MSLNLFGVEFSEEQRELLAKRLADSLEQEQCEIDINDEDAIRNALNESFSRTKELWGGSHENVEIEIITLPNYNKNGNGYKIIFKNEPNGESCEFVEELWLEDYFAIDVDENDDVILYDA